MDIDVARWVLDFLLRQTVDDGVLNALVRVLPLPNDNWSLKKAMLLRRIQSEIAKGLVSEKILDLLERIEELDCEEGGAASKAMKGAYCAVAVDCVVRFLDESEDREAKYFDAVKRIWRGRVWKMERSEKVGLISNELQSWKDEIEAAVWDASVCENVRLRNRGNDALEAVRVYVSEAWESMGPSFLDLVAGTVSDSTMKEVLGLGNNQICNGVGERAACLPDSSPDLVDGKGNNEMHRGIVLPRRKHVAVKRTRGVSSGTSRGVKITDTEDLDIRKSSNNYGCLPIPEINKVQEALRTSCLELQAAVKDPLPDALQFAENVLFSMGRENMNQEPSVRQNRVDVDISNPSIDRSAETAQANEADLGNQCSRHQSNVPKPSLFARNSTARTSEWDDSIDTLPEGSPGRGRIHLPTPKRRLVSPLKKHEITKFARRRKNKKWNTLEEDTLRTGVQKYGAGNWKLILNSHRDIFEERTEVDLKDKWRNMLRY